MTEKHPWISLNNTFIQICDMKNIKAVTWHKYLDSQLNNSAFNDGIWVSGHLNPERVGTELSRFNLVKIMAADALAPYVARTSAAMILTVYNM